MLFDSVVEYDTEIEFVRTEMRNAVKAKDFHLNTGQSDQRVVMDLKGIRDYLTLLAAEKQALVEQLEGSSVTGITYRRFA